MMRRFLAFLLTTLLLVPTSLTVAQAAPALEHRAATGGFEKMTKGYKCKKEMTRNSVVHFKCASITWRKANIEMNGPLSVRVRNRTGSKQSMSCTWEETKTWTFSATVSSEIEAGVIFAKAKVTISGSVSRAKAVKVGASVSVTVLPRHEAWCMSGMARPSFGGKIRTLECGWTGACRWTATRSYSAKVPQQFVWELRERKLG